ncbi:MAG: hypothetical protein V8Q75_05235 [Bacilli bacterium]
MNLKKDKYIILELIPTALNPENGVIVQLSALKIRGLKLEDRFDYRLKEDLIPYRDFMDLISYDKDNFNYVDSSEDILKAFEKWIASLPLLIIDNEYTHNYLENINNSKESIFKYLNIDNTDDVIERLMKKYQLEPTNHVVDILYESLIHEL